ncbi:MAG: SCO2-like protein [Massilia sp.]|nr:SCO2-like protein [Massilia sp.]
MHTRRSFLAFAAAAQLISPLVRAMPVRAPRAMVARLPPVVLQTHAGRDVHFCNDLVSGRLLILNLQYADSANLLLPPAWPSPGAGLHAAYLYCLTLQPAIGRPADLHRHMDAYGTGGAWPLVSGAHGEVELVRIRLGMCSGT